METFFVDSFPREEEVEVFFRIEDVLRRPSLVCESFGDFLKPGGGISCLGV